MKKRFVILWLSVHLSVSFSYAQDISTSAIKLKDLQVPNSPAFILLDVAPTSIEEPSTAKAFSTSILNAISENNGIPQNYGVEFTPFWFIKHPTFTSFKYFGISPDGKNRRVFAGLRMTAVSFALINNQTSKDTLLSKTSNLSLGLRSTILKVISHVDLRDIVKFNDSLIHQLRKANIERAFIGIKIKQAKKDSVQLNNELTIENDPAKRILLLVEIQNCEKTLTSLEETYKKLLNNTSQDPEIIKIESLIRDILARKPIFTMDGALALNWAFENNNFKSNYLDRFGGWLTMVLSLPLQNQSSSIKNNYLNLYAVERYLSGQTLGEINPMVRQDVIDSGGKLEIEIDRFSISGEYIYRLNLSNSSDNTFRATGMIKFKIVESLYISGAFGKNFGETNNLTAQFGINWGFGSGLESVSPMK